MNDIESSLRSLPEDIGVSTSPDLLRSVQRLHGRRTVRRRAGIAAVAAGALAVTALPGVLIDRNRSGATARLATAAASSTAYTVASLDAALAALAANAPAEAAESGRYAYVRFEELRFVKPGSNGGVPKTAVPDANVVKPAADGVKDGNPAKPPMSAADEAAAKTRKVAALAVEGAPTKTSDANDSKPADSGAGDPKRPPADLTPEQKAKWDAAPKGSDVLFSEVRVNELWIDHAGTGWKKSKLERTTFLNAADETKHAAELAEKNVDPNEDAGGKVETVDPALDTAKLPTDPDAMFAYLTANAGGKQANAVTAGLEFLQGRVLPLMVRIAVYRAMLKVPGVTVANGVADFAGHAGVAIGLVADKDNDKLYQTIIDPTSGAYLGHKVSLTKGSPEFPVGTVLEHSSVQQQGFTDTLKARPAA